jgi:protein gp37
VADQTQIEWCDSTFNSWEGCQKVGPGCDHCYAETRNARFGGGVAGNWGPGAPRRRTRVSNWRKPLAWQRDAARFLAEHGRRQRVFCASLADVFDNAAPDEWRADLAALIEQTPDLDWLLLTKRIGNAGKMLDAMFDKEPPPNVWLGATIVNQAEADRDVPKLLATSARVRFLSMEPLLGPVDLTEVSDDATALDPECWGDCACGTLYGFDPGCRRNGGDGSLARKIDWIIAGGESGPGARPTNPQWFRDLRDQCDAAGVPFLFKQWGEWVSVSEVEGFAGNLIHEFDDGRCVRRIGKARAGRLLDGAQHDGFPL